MMRPTKGLWKAAQASSRCSSTSTAQAASVPPSGEAATTARLSTAPRMI